MLGREIHDPSTDEAHPGHGLPIIKAVGIATLYAAKFPAVFDGEIHLLSTIRAIGEAMGVVINPLLACSVVAREFLVALILARRGAHLLVLVGAKLFITDDARSGH